jgi:glycosyltransferase involved in cell wall biosynthesis
MIVRNEERNLADCLAPVAALFDEIVIVDTGSQDNTKQIARQFTPHIFDFPWCDDFSAARNESLGRSHGDWVFWLDADDRLDADNVAKLKTLLDGLDDQPRAFLMDTACWSQYECEGPRLITHPRLFRRHADLRWRGRVHEQLRPDAATLGYEMLWSDVRIEHVGYQDDALKLRKLNRDVRLLRMDYAVDPDDTSTLVHLGLSYARLGLSNEARKYLLRLLKTDHASEWMRRVYSTLAELALREGKFQDGLDVIARGLSQFPDDQNLLYMQAECLYELDRFDAARGALLRIISSTDERQYHGGSPAEVRHKVAPRKLGDIHRILGAYAKAVDAFESVLSVFPEDTLTWYSLGRVYVDTHCWDRTEATAQRLRLCPQGHIFASLLLATWHLEHHEFDAAAVLIDELIAEVPQMPFPRLMRAELLTRTGAPIETRIQACRDVLRVQPGNPDVVRMLVDLEDAQRRPTQPRADQWCTSVVLGAGIVGV